MNRKIIVLVLGVCAFGTASAQSPQDAEVSMDDFFDIIASMKTVTTPARREQKVIESVSSVSVVTAEDIRRSGMTNIPDILRNLAGVDVMRMTASDHEVSIRGFALPLSNKVLVMINGRSVYLHTIGNVEWEKFPIVLEEIDRIEVVRGPGSSLYGPHAYNGVIHIITKDPAQLAGTRVSYTGGERGTTLVSGINAWQGEKFGYKVSAGHRAQDDWRDSNQLGLNVNRGDAAFAYNFAEDTRLKVSLGVSDSASGELLSQSLGNFDERVKIYYGQVDFTRSKLKIKAFTEHFSSILKDQPIFVPYLDQDDHKYGIYDIEAQHQLDWSERNSIVYGASARHNFLRGGSDTAYQEDHKQDLVGIFLENQSKVFDKLTVFMGGRYDHHPLTKGQTVPRGGVVYAPNENHALRASYTQAYRIPSFTESYIQKTIRVTPVVTVTTLGNKDAAPEKISSYEVGYTGLFGRRVTTEASLFYNQYKDFIYITRIDNTPPQLANTFVNQLRRNGLGGEIGAEYLAAAWLKLNANYSHVRVYDKEDDPTSTANEKDTTIRAFPKHKVNAGAHFAFFSGITADVTANYVDNTVMERPITRALTKVESYTLVNARLAYAFLGRRAEIAVAGFNLGNETHNEFPQAPTALSLQGGDPIGRVITGSVSYKF